MLEPENEQAIVEFSIGLVTIKQNELNFYNNLEILETRITGPILHLSLLPNIFPSAFCHFKLNLFTAVHSVSLPT